jgi:hypothetical protein
MAILSRIILLIKLNLIVFMNLMAIMCMAVAQIGKIKSLKLLIIKGVMERYVGL